MSKMIVICAIAMTTLVLSPAFADGNEGSPASESAKPDGTLELSGGSIAAGIGYVWGNGTLTVGGGKHHFSVNGLSIVDVGATSISASGVVYHLTKLSDFQGNYTALGAGATIAGGGDAVVLQNQHGVVIKVVSTAVGLRFHLSASGVNISFSD